MPDPIFNPAAQPTYSSGHGNYNYGGNYGSYYATSTTYNPSQVAAAKSLNNINTSVEYDLDLIYELDRFTKENNARNYDKNLIGELSNHTK